MKKLLFLMNFLFLGYFLIGQTYHPLIKTNCYWDVLHGDASICWYGSGNRYFFNGDTLISGQQYKILHSYPIGITLPGGPFCPPYYALYQPILTVGFMREDTTQKKVYLLNETGGESLLYDFSSSIIPGDTLHLFGSSGLLVTEVSNVTLANGAIRKQISTTDLNFPFFNSYIEGIGASKGLINYFGMLEYDDLLICVKENNIPLIGGNQCIDFLGTENVETYSNPGISLSPNPAYDVFNLTLTQDCIPSTFILMDLTGKIVVEKKMSEVSNQIPIIGITPGEYFYKVTSSGRVLNGKCTIVK